VSHGDARARVLPGRLAAATSPFPALTPAVVPPRNRFLVVITLISHLAFGLAAMTMCLPSLPEWEQTFGASRSTVQLTFSCYLVAFGAMQLVFGPLSDRHGRKPMLLVGITLAGLASLGAALATSLEALIVARIVQGLGCSACTVVGRAAVQDLFDAQERTRIMAYIGMTMGVCSPVATVLGGYVHALFGWQANFALLAVLAVVVGVATVRVVPRVRPQVVPAQTGWLRGMLQSYRQLCREPGFLCHVSILAMTVAAYYAFLSGAPAVLHSYGVGTSDIGWYIMGVPLSYIVGNFLTSRLVHRLPGGRLVAIGQGLSLAGILVTLGLSLAGVHSPLVMSVPLMLVGIGHGFIIPPSLVATVGVLPALAGAAVAVAGVLQQVMGAVGGYAVGWVSSRDAIGVGCIMLVFTLGAVGAQLAVPRRQPTSVS
jgi:DHA1 family bicyclomycin/chloramphenicol resistance-like MFS transporter